MDSYYDPDNELEDEYKNSPIPDGVLVTIGQSRGFLERLGEIGGRDYFDMCLKFVQGLEEQEMLEEASMVVGAHFIERTDDGMLYTNKFMTEVPGAVEELVEIEESDNMDVSNLVEQYRRCSTYFEHALPPIITLINYLEDDEVDPNESASLRLSNALSRVQSFDPLSGFVEPFNPNIRNALSHGGNTGFSPNHINESIKFRYEVGDSVQTNELSYFEFRNEVLEATTSAVSLFVFPLFLINISTYAKILEKVEDQD